MWGVALMKVIIISMMIDIKGAESWVSPWKLTYDVDGPLEAEVGSSLIIGCSYTFKSDGVVFIPEIARWYKCEKPNHCLPSDMIFSSSDVNAGQDVFKGRVSLLEPNVTHQNTSIVIRDLRPSDTGSYQLKVVGQRNAISSEMTYYYSFRYKKPITVTGLAQPVISGGPTVVDVGANLTLTCEAQSSPPSTVTWTKVGSHIPLETGTERAKLVIQNATRDHSGRYRCTAQHLTKTLSTFADVSVIECPAPPMITGLTTIEQGDTLMLTCEAQSSPPSTVTWTIAGSHILLETGTERAKLVIQNATRDHSGRYSCTAQHLTKTLSTFADVSVIEKCPVPPMITGLTTIEQGDTLMLTCEAQSSPLSIVTWTKAGSHIPLETGMERANLLIPNATSDHSGRYSCTALVQATKTISSFADVTVLNRYTGLIPEEFFTIPGVVTSVTISLTLIGVYCLAKKAFHACTSRKHQEWIVNGRPCVEMVTQQTGGRRGVDGVDGPEDTQPKALEGVGERGQEGEVPDPATTPV